MDTEDTIDLRDTWDTEDKKRRNTEFNSETTNAMKYDFESGKVLGTFQPLRSQYKRQSEEGGEEREQAVGLLLPEKKRKTYSTL